MAEAYAAARGGVEGVLTVCAKVSFATSWLARHIGAFQLAHPTGAPASGTVAGKAGTTEDDKASWYVGTAESVSTAVVVYRLDLTKSLEPLELKGIAGTSTDSVPYGIWSEALSPPG